ncbi:MAG TPA: response regulator [Chitinispirillaceae bacterium]|nr:response regulator [Chitinispirillaceae bacterium]
MAEKISQSLAAILSRLNKKINLLMVDDEAGIAASLCELFDSPLFNIFTAHSYEQAVKTIDSHNGNWHAWILDIDLGDEKSGLDLIRAYRNFPYKIVLSGLGSMGVATRALELGAKMAIDKNPGSLSALFDETCKLSTLGFLLQGRPTKYFEVFSLLAKAQIRTARDWAHCACITPRQLSRICEIHGAISPLHFIAHYHAVHLLLENKTVRADEHGLLQAIKELSGFDVECLDISSRNSDDFAGLLIR